MPSVYEIVTNKIIEQLESVKPSDYSKPWFDLGTMPHNAISGKNYRGINVFLLAGMGKNFASYKQWESKKCQVKKGEKSSLVTFWSPMDKVNSKGEAEKSFILRYYNVFESSQVEGDYAREVEQSKESKLQPHEKIEHAESLVNGYLARESIKLVSGDCASYMPSKDQIEIPHIGQFTSPEQYYSVLLHEATHSTGHETRLKRDIKNGFGSESYAKEELVAELGSAMLCAELGLEAMPRADHAAYIQSWLKALKNDSKYVIQAAGKAQKAADLIKGISFEKGEE